METNDTTPSWEALITNRIRNPNCKSRTCKIYNRQPRTIGNDLDKLCPCGRLVRSHSFDGESLQARAEKQNNPNWNPPIEFKPSACSASVPVTIFGRLKPNGCKFMRLDAQAEMSIVYDLLVNDCG